MASVPEKKPRLSFGEMWHRSLSSTGFSIPTGKVRFAVESSPKAAKCRICGMPIPAKARRVLVYAYLGRRYVASNGGSYSGTRFHYHLECVKGILDLDAAERHHHRVCYVCGQPPQTWSSLFIAKQLPYGMICESCEETRKEYKRCDLCDVIYQTNTLSRIIEGSILSFWPQGEWHEGGRKVSRVGQLACIHCAEGEGLVTTRNRDRYLREQQEAAARREALAEGMRTWLQG